MTPDDLRAQIAAHGGLCTVPDLARRWGTSKQRVAYLAARESFPAPIYSSEGGRIQRLWLADEADAWRAGRE